MKLGLLVLVLFAIGDFVAAQRPDRPSPAPTIPSQRREGILLKGRVLPHGSGSTLPEIMTVTLTSLGGGFRKTELVRSGLFQIVQVPFGDYIIRLECEGFETVELRVDLQNPTAGLRFLQLTQGAPLGAGRAVPEPGDSIVGVDHLAVPEKALKYLDKASRAGSQGNTDRAIRLLEKAIELHPRFHEAHHNLAVHYLNKGLLKEAFEAARRSIEIKPTALAFRNLGLIHLRGGDFKGAVSHLQTANDLDPSDQQTVQSLGEAYFGLGQYRTALGWLKVARKMGENPVLHLAIGHCHLRLGADEQALASFESFLSAASDHPQSAEVRKLVEDLKRGR